MFECPDFVNFTRDEVLEEYRKLYDRFQELRESNEEDTQKIHELKRSLDTATAAQAYLSQELEQYANSENKDLENELHKAQAELLEMKKTYGELEVSFLKLQQDYSILLAENSKISRYVEKSVKCKEQHQSDVDMKIDEFLLQIESLENENTELLEKMEDFEERSVSDTRTIAEYKKNIEILRDQVLCLEENLQSKRIDLDEKLQIIESTQEQLAEANAKIAALSQAPVNNGRKGNSLFAEVDDQRQAMKQLLTAQKKSYIEMKKIYVESEHEIRRLKRENISMHTELNTCSKIFCNADKVYQEKLNERISNMMNQNEYLECKLKWTEERIRDLADDRGVLFLNSMLNYHRKETDDLKGQLHSARIQKASLEEQLRNAQQDMARWRFESLKSRCVLIDREHLLTENKIPFKPVHALEYNISENQQKDAKPRIIPMRTFENVIGRKSITPAKGPTKQEVGCPEQNSMDISISNSSNIKKEHMEQLNMSVDPTDSLSENEKKISNNELSCVEVKEVPYKEANSTIPNNINLRESLGMLEKKENVIHGHMENSNSINTTDDIPILNKFAKLKANAPSPMRPSQRSLEKSTSETSEPSGHSILTKQNDLLFKVSCKNVQFSSEGDTVHNLSADTPSPARTTSDVRSTASNVNSKNNAKRSRTKSNVVVRRVVVSSKHD